MLLFLFLIFGLFGVFGETIFGLWWDSLFKKRFWVYRSDTLFHSYSSLLNFIPWGTGGMLYLTILEIFHLQFSNPLFKIELSDKTPFYLFYLAIGLPVLIITFVYALFSRRRKKIGFEFKEVSAFTYTMFCLPTIIPILALSVLRSFDYLIIAFLFGAVAFLAEYFFGKSLVFFISKKLWYYSYSTFDNKHSTILSLIPFATCGFYFWAIYSIILSFF